MESSGGDDDDDDDCPFLGLADDGAAMMMLMMMMKVSRRWVAMVSGLCAMGGNANSVSVSDDLITTTSHLAKERVRGPAFGPDRFGR